MKHRLEENKSRFKIQKSKGEQVLPFFYKDGVRKEGLLVVKEAVCRSGFCSLLLECCWAAVASHTCAAASAWAFILCVFTPLLI